MFGEVENRKRPGDIEVLERDVLEDCLAHTEIGNGLGPVLWRRYVLKFKQISHTFYSQVEP